MAEQAAKASKRAASAEHFDLVIAGGGMVGASLALALRQRAPALRVAVVEPRPPQAGYTAGCADSPSHSSPSFDGRAIALSAGSCACLEQIGLWPSLAAFAEPIRHIHVSERGALAATRLHHDHFGLASLGQVIPVQPMGQQLWQTMAADRCSELTLLQSGISALERTQEQIRLTLDDGRSLSAALLVGSDGAHSVVRQLAGIETETQRYAQQAVIATVHCELPHQGWAYERLSEQGPLAMLPLTGNRMALVWSLPPAEAEQLVAAPEPEFLARLQRAFGWRQGRLLAALERFAYPLAMRQVVTPVSHRVALVGNAAHALHPIAGQGYNLGLRDVMVLVELLAAEAGDPGRYALLADYAARRQGDVALTLGWSDALVRIFAQEQAMVRTLRRAGLEALNWLPGARAAVGWQGMGFGLFSR